MDDTKKSITKCKWYGYKICQRLDLENEILLFKMRRLEEDNMYFIQFNRRVYLEFDGDEQETYETKRDEILNSSTNLNSMLNQMLRSYGLVK